MDTLSAPPYCAAKKLSVSLTQGGSYIPLCKSMLKVNPVFKCIAVMSAEVWCLDKTNEVLTVQKKNWVMVLVIVLEWAILNIYIYIYICGRVYRYQFSRRTNWGTGKISNLPSSCELQQLGMQPRSLPLGALTWGVRQLALKEGVWLPAWKEIKLAWRYVLRTSAV